MKKIYLPLLTLHFSLFTLNSQSAVPIEILPGPFADVRGNLVVETIPFDAAIDKPMRWVFSDPGTMRPARIVKNIDLSALALYPDAPSTNFIAYIDADASGSYTPGEPFGVSNGRDTPQIELSNMSAITPRVRLWDSMNTTNASDRGKLTGTDWLHDPYGLYDRFEKTEAKYPKNRVRIVRYAVDRFPLYKVGVDAGVVLEKDFEETSRDFLHEGDFLADGDLDIDWKNLYTDVVDRRGTQMAGCEITNVTYLIVYNWDAASYRTDDDTNTQVKANATLVTRRFEKTRSVPTAVSAYSTPTNAVFSWKVENEEPWASQFCTTYTAFKVNVYDASSNHVWNSGIIRLPARDKNGVYTFTTTDSSLFTLNSSLSWRVAVYNAKFKTDTLMAMDTEGDPFSSSQTIGDQPPPEPDPSGTVDLAIYPGPYASTRGPVVIEQERNPFRYRAPQKWTIPDCRLRRPPVITHRVFCSDTNAPFIAYIDADASGSYTPGEPFGFSNVDAASHRVSIELTDMSAITPRVKLWNSACDRSTWTGTNWLNIGSSLYDRFEKTEAKYPKNHVRVVRYAVDRFPLYKVGVYAGGVVLEKDFCETSRDFLHEGDFLADGDLDIDWKNLYYDVVDWWGAQMAGCEITNVTYLIVYNWDAASYRDDDDTNTLVKANATLVTRRFEKTRSVPTAVSAYHTPTNAVFSWKVENEEPWASQFGTTYTAFKVKVLNGSTEVWNSGILRLPARDKNGVYTFTTTDSSLLTLNSSLSWRVAVYNAKFKTDTLIGVWNYELHTGDPFSPVQPLTTP